MTRTQHIALALVFIAVNLLGALVNADRVPDRALDDAHYEDTTDDELVAAYADAPVICVAAATTSGCG